MARDTEDLIQAADRFVDMLAQGWDMMDSTFQSLSCTEAEGLADLARAAGEDLLADRIIDSHAEVDDEGDIHFRGTPAPFTVGDSFTLPSGRTGRVETMGSRSATIRFEDGSAAMHVWNPDR